MDLNLRLVHALLTVAEEGSITKAAARMHLTQQAVSGQIQQLEKVVGTTLLLRTAQGVVPSPAGHEVVQRGPALLAAARAMVSEARLVGEGRSGRLRIAFKAQSTAHFMPNVVAALEKEAPGIEVDVMSVSTLADELDALADGRADAALLWLPAGDDRFAAAEVLAEGRVVALPPDHRLADRDAVTLADLAQEPVVGPHPVMPPDVVRFWYVDPRPDGSPVVYGAPAHTPEECLQLVAAGRGIWIAPASTAGYFTHPRLAWVPLTDADPFRLAVAWRRESPPALLTCLVRNCRRWAGEPG
ncbi:LysR family transcriptional regulator [Streptomyces sp. NPDC059002]|uniref:LysR family transcriptional regulator n=1 Tax=Streptomyces sp. NPDC059002 TaxID=3346690 RepID=UPI0036B1FC54